jgi:hypothetical protein
MGKEYKPHVSAPSGDNKIDARPGGRNDRHPRHRWNQGHQSGKFKGKTKKIKFNNFDNTGPHDATQFNKSLKNIADYLQLNHGNDVSEAVCNMTTVHIAIPLMPVGKIDPNDASGTTHLPVTDVDLYLWKCKHNKLKITKTNTTKTWPRPTLLSIINAPQLSKMILKVWMCLRQSAAPKM